MEILYSTYMYIFPNICQRQLFLMFLSRFQRFLTSCCWEKRIYVGFSQWEISLYFGKANMSYSANFILMFESNIWYSMINNGQQFMLQNMCWVIKIIDFFQDSIWYLRCRTQDFHLQKIMFSVNYSLLALYYDESDNIAG